ncbi:class I SAM-dependent methyltransferase [bacterium]|nr:class I SAM-dependent methyltransferase [bacterium]
MAGYQKIKKTIVKKVPGGKFLRESYWRTRHFSRNFIAKIRANLGRYNIPHPDTIYWISPERIVYHTNYNPSGRDIPFRDRIFDPDRDKGKIIGGNWDISDFKFTDLDIYKAFELRILRKEKWENTKFYRRVLSDINSGKTKWGCSSKEELDKRFDYLDRLIESIRTNGYKLSEDVIVEDEDKSFAGRKEEVTVNIGRDGQFLFENGRHRLSIAKILKIPKIPVKVVVRHKEWQNFREYVLQYARTSGGRLYQPPIHPDLSDIPVQHGCEDRFKAIVESVGYNGIGKKVLDIGAYIGYFCHRFEDYGCDCYAVEPLTELCYIMRKIKIAEGKNFTIIEKSIFDTDIVERQKFDIVIALNIFHHFLKTEDDYHKLTNLLAKLNVDVMIFEPHLPDEPQMKDAYRNYDVNEFVKFILKNSPLSNFEHIYTADDGRKIFKLYK